MRRSGRGCGKGGTVQAAMAELEPRVGNSGFEDIVGDDNGDFVAVFGEDGEAWLLPDSALDCRLELVLEEEEKMALNMAADCRAGAH